MTILKGTKIIVKIEDLTKGSRVKVTNICDDCSKIIPNITFGDIINQRENSIDGKDRCFDCGKIVGGDSLVKRYVNDENCIAKVNEEFAVLFWNKEDTFTRTCQSNRKADFKCPNCNNKISVKIEKAYRRGLSCNRCSDGIKYPEKFMSNVLHQLNVEFETQKSFEWSEDSKYDFYLDLFNLIIETHGGQHYAGRFESYSNGRNLTEEQENDKNKEEMVLENKVNYIIIDSRLSELEHIKKSIEKSEISKLFDLSNIDWGECHRYACKSIVKETWDKYNEGIKDNKVLARIIGIDRSTVQRYLKKGNKVGLCDYKPQAKIQAKREEEQKRSD